MTLSIFSKTPLRPRPFYSNEKNVCNNETVQLLKDVAALLKTNYNDYSSIEGLALVQ